MNKQSQIVLEEGVEQLYETFIACKDKEPDVERFMDSLTSLISTVYVKQKGRRN
ncbi:MAG: hypothetical protein K2H85_02900 [Allobaculum sp.]|nr:hypothetical protein [Allobaculum sp.]